MNTQIVNCSTRQSAQTTTNLSKVKGDGLGVAIQCCCTHLQHTWHDSERKVCNNVNAITGHKYRAAGRKCIPLTFVGHQVSRHLFLALFSFPSNFFFIKKKIIILAMSTRPINLTSLLLSDQKTKFLVIDGHACIVHRFEHVWDRKGYYLQKEVYGSNVFDEHNYNYKVFPTNQAKEPVFLYDTYKILTLQPLVLQHRNGHIRHDLRITSAEHFRRIRLLRNAALVQVMKWGTQERVCRIVRDKRVGCITPQPSDNRQLAQQARRMLNKDFCARVLSEISSPASRLYNSFDQIDFNVFLKAVFKTLSTTENNLAPRLCAKLCHFAHLWFSKQAGYN